MSNDSVTTGAHRGGMQHAAGTIGFEQRLTHAPSPAFRRLCLAEQCLRQRRDALAGMIVIDHPLPVQRLPGPWMAHRPEHVSVIRRFLVPGVRHIAQPRQRAFPTGKDRLDHGGEFVRHRVLSQFRWLSQIHRSQACPATVVDRHGGRRGHLERIAWLHPQRDPVATDGQHRPPISFPIKGFFQPTLDLGRLCLPLNGCVPRPTDRSLPAISSCPRSRRARDEGMQHDVLRGAPRRRSTAPRPRSRPVGPAQQPQRPFQGKPGRFTPLALPIPIAETPEHDLAESAWKHSGWLSGG